VFRYDENAFGQQLDEVLLLPPPALEAEQDRVDDFLWNADSWWVTMTNAETGGSGVYRFDADWNYLGQLPLEPGTQPAQLLGWGEKLLVRDAGRLHLQRFNRQGAAEAPLESSRLVELVDRDRVVHRFKRAGWRGALLITALATVAALCLGWLQAARALVYRGRSARGAQPVDDLADDISWIAPEPGRQNYYRGLNLGSGILALALVLVAVGAGVSAMQLGALLLVVGSAAAALWSLQRSPIGHVGVVDGELLLVDHANLYHLGSDARLQHRGPFLLLDDVAVYTGSALLPAFSHRELAERVAPLLEGGVRVDRKTVLVKLMQARHPLVRAITWTLGGCLLAALLLVLQWW
jgi:hypothetical protein